MNERYIASKGDPEPVGVDFDNTVARGIWPKLGIGEPIEGAREAIQEIRDAGNQVVLYTARPWGELNGVRNWLEDQRIAVDNVLCGKPKFKLYIGDEALRFSGNWEMDMYNIRRILGR